MLSMEQQTERLLEDFFSLMGFNLIHIELPIEIITPPANICLEMCGDSMRFAVVLPIEERLRNTALLALVERLVPECTPGILIHSFLSGNNLIASCIIPTEFTAQAWLALYRTLCALLQQAYQYAENTR